MDPCDAKNIGEPGMVPAAPAILNAIFHHGSARAYITTREEIADSMGGVAIAISLVPPLCVVNISINEGRWDAAIGAFTLFLTNFLAILLAGGVTFMLGGPRRLAATPDRVRAAYPHRYRFGEPEPSGDPEGPEAHTRAPSEPSPLTLLPAGHSVSSCPCG